MGRRVDDSRPYSDEDKAWLLTRSGGKERIAVNERRFAHLSKKDREALTKRVSEDRKKEEKMQQALLEEQKRLEEESYHPDDVAQVEHLNLVSLKERLEDEGLRVTVTKKDLQDPEDAENPFTEKEALAYRLLEHLDAKRKASERS